MAAECPVDTLKASRPKRKHTIAPAPGLLPWTREIAILEAVGTELAVSLWKILRRIRLWMEAEPEKRTALFEIDKKSARQRLGSACVDAPDLVEAFGTFALLIRVPDRIEAHQVAEACHQVREWAEEHSWTDAAMLFAEAAAMVEPDSAVHANIAGRLCRRTAHDERSSTWYQRAYRLAARSRDRDEQIRALLGYGGLMYHLGNHAEARRYNEQAVGVARNYGRLAKAAEAKHDMLLVAAEAGTYAEGERHALQALQYYPMDHTRIPYLVHDVAFFFIRNRLYSAALPLLHRVRRLITQQAEQALVWSSIARAAGGSGQRQLYQEAADEVLSLAGLFEEHAAPSLWNMAEGAWYIGDWERAERVAKMAVEIARTRKESEPERGALALLVRVAARESPPGESEAPPGNRTERLSRDCLAKLEQWKVRDRRRRRSRRNATTNGGNAQTDQA